VMSILVALDECTTESGCLWLAGGVDEVLATDDRGVVREDIARTLSWSAVELAPGDAVCIDGLTPHYSDANQTARPRRVLVASIAMSAMPRTRCSAEPDISRRSSSSPSPSATPVSGCRTCSAPTAAASAPVWNALWARTRPVIELTARAYGSQCGTQSKMPLPR